MPPRAVWKTRPSRAVPNLLMWARSRLLAAYLSAHRTMINGSALCAAWLSPGVTTLLAWLLPTVQIE
jgi:hypothetical protein